MGSSHSWISAATKGPLTAFYWFWIDFWHTSFSPTAESFGVSAQIGAGVVRGGPEARFHEGSTRVPLLLGI